MVDFSKAVAAAAAATNMNEAQTGGGDWTPPAEGVGRARFVSYIEVGQHDKTFNGATKKAEFCFLGFEISGPNHPKNEAGNFPIITIKLTKSINEKAKYYKLFKRLNEDGQATHMAQLLGKAFLVDVRHNVVKGTEGKKDTTYANLDSADGAWTFRSLRKQDEDTGEWKIIAVADQVAPTQCFLWDFADKDQWNSIFIDGEYEATEAKDGQPARPAKSKNRWQIMCQSAFNWDGSPMSEILKADGIEFEPGASVQEQQEAGDAAADPLEAAG